MALWDRFQSATSYRAGGEALCHLAGMISVLIRGPTDATALHLRAVTQPESTDADEVDARNRRLGMPHPPPLLFCFFLPCLARRREAEAASKKSVGSESK